jgi:hypothetical protein
LVRAESLVGRLEYLLGASHAVPAPHVGEATPPVDPEAQKIADKYVAQRVAEIEDERTFFEAERELIE